MFQLAPGTMLPHTPIACHEMGHFLMLFLQGRLPAEQRATTELHLVACEHCREITLPGTRERLTAIQAYQPLFIPD